MVSRSNKESRPNVSVDGGGKVVEELMSDRTKVIDEALGETETDDSPIGLIKQGKSPLLAKRTKQQQRDLRIQLSDAGISQTKNTARDKLRLRQIRSKKK